MYKTNSILFAFQKTFTYCIGYLISSVVLIPWLQQFKYLINLIVRTSLFLDILCFVKKRKIDKIYIKALNSNYSHRNVNFKTF